MDFNLSTLTGKLKEIVKRCFPKTPLWQYLQLSDRKKFRTYANAYFNEIEEKGGGENCQLDRRWMFIAA
jgi:hypothetical protein